MNKMAEGRTSHLMASLWPYPLNTHYACPCWLLLLPSPATLPGCFPWSRSMFWQCTEWTKVLRCCCHKVQPMMVAVESLPIYSLHTFFHYANSFFLKAPMVLLRSFSQCSSMSDRPTHGSGWNCWKANLQPQKYPLTKMDRKISQLPGLSNITNWSNSIWPPRGPLQDWAQISHSNKLLLHQPYNLFLSLLILLPTR